MKRISLPTILAIGALAAVLAVPVHPARSSPEESILVTDPSTCPGCRQLETLLVNAGWQRVPEGFRKGDVLLRTVASHPDSRFLPSLLENGQVSAVGAGEVRDRAETLARPTPPAFPATPNELLQQFVPARERSRTADRLSDTLRQATGLGDALDRLIQGAARAVGNLLQGLGPAPGAGTFSQFPPSPDPTRIGYGPRARYRAPTEGGPTSFPGIDADPARLHQRGFSDEPKPHITDTARLHATQYGVPAQHGGYPGNPFWADNCRCVASRGGFPGLTYHTLNGPAWTVGGSEEGGGPMAGPGALCILSIFPIPCEVCYPITQHDYLVTTAAECLRHRGAGHPGF